MNQTLYKYCKNCGYGNIKSRKECGKCGNKKFTDLPLTEYRVKEVE